MGSYSTTKNPKSRKGENCAVLERAWGLHAAPEPCPEGHGANFTVARALDLELLKGAPKYLPLSDADGS